MNVILLGKCQFDGHTAIIDNPNQLSHCRTVLKVAVGDWLKIGQLGGQLGIGQVDGIFDDKIVLKNIELSKNPPKKLGITLILALPRPKVLRRLIIDMVAMGVDRIVLLNSVKSEKSYWQSPLVGDEKIQSYVLEGLQQGVDTIAPTIVKARRFKPFVEDELANFGQTLVVAHPYAPLSFRCYVKDNGLPDVLIVGAEGGFSAYEIQLLSQNGVIATSFGERILRTEAAVNALLGQWL